ncbi:MAG: helix-turn-helix domain-containing protein [Candidatus Azambacteria bacterium]|nr:helix-turn-helix domain-containing protein [Candidatus Azambacteria bacterium]
MPYKFTTNKIKLPREADRRVKLTSDDKARIALLHDQGLSQRAIARAVGCSRRMVVFILYPERLAHAKALYKDRRKDGRYYDRKKNTEATRKHRRHKKEVLSSTPLPCSLPMFREN